MGVQGIIRGSFQRSLPEELYCFFRWVISGPNTILSVEEKSNEVHKRAMSLVQSTISASLTEHQVGNKRSEIFKSLVPQQLTIGLAVYQFVKSKELVNMLRGFGLSVEHNRLLRVESQIEASVIKRMEHNDGLFLPKDIVQGRHVFFAIDNIDSQEDTYDGSNTLHGMSMAIYWKCQADDEKPQLW